jgi:hypothetical protein
LYENNADGHIDINPEIEEAKQSDSVFIQDSKPVHYLSRRRKRNNMLASLDIEKYKTYLGEGALQLSKEKKTRNRQLIEAYCSSIDCLSPGVRNIKYSKGSSRDNSLKQTSKRHRKGRRI